MQPLRSFLAVIPLGLALATVTAPDAEAQRRQIVICRDGTLEKAMPLRSATNRWPCHRVETGTLVRKV